VNIVLKIGISILILGVGLVGMMVLGQKPEVPTQAAKSEDEAVEVVTVEVKEWNQPFDINVDGEAVTYRVVTVGTEVAGKVTNKTPEARGGTFVQKGDLLFEIDSTNYQLEVERLKAELNQIDEELKAIDVDAANTTQLIALAKEDQELQNKQLNRMKALLSRRTANETEVDAAVKQELMARNTVQTLQNQQNSLTQQRKTKQAGRVFTETQLARAEVDVKRCRVESPLEGRIVEDEVEQGDYIKAGEVLVHVSDGGRMEIKTKLRAEELAWIWQQHAIEGSHRKVASPSDDPLNLPKIPCEVGYEFQGVETIWDGYVSRIEGTGIDRDTRTFPCRVLVEKPRETRFNDSAGGRATVAPPTLLSGMFVNVRIPVESPLELLRIPIAAVRPGNKVWVFRDGRLDVQDVSLAHIQGQHALLRRDGSGLQPDDRVVVSPLSSVRDGLPLRNVAAESDDELVPPPRGLDQ